MTIPLNRPLPDVTTALLSAAAVTAQFVAGKAARDALYLAHLDVTSLPLMVIATSAVSILLVLASSRGLRRVSAAVLVPGLFAANALLLILQWGLIAVAPRVAAPLMYLQISGLGPMLGSGFWLIATERFDPRTAKRQFGRIAAAGTLGGLLGGLLAERIAATLGLAATLPVLSVINVFCAWQIRRLSAPLDAPGRTHQMELSPELAIEEPRSGLKVMAETPYLRHLAALVLLGTIGAALLEYLFKLQAVSSFGRGENLLRFFAIYYAAVSLVTFVLQSAGSRLALERLGLGLTTGTASAALVLGGLGGLLAPGLESIVAARAGESAFRGSLFRAGYELFYTPVPTQEKRAAKSLIDVGFDRLGDAMGGGAVRLALLLPASLQYGAMIWLAIATGVAALLISSRLNRGYIKTLERSLLNRAVEFELADLADMTTRTTVLRTMTSLHSIRNKSAVPTPNASQSDAAPPLRSTGVLGGLDSEALQVLALRSRDRDRILRVLHSEEGLPAPLVAYVIPLLAWDPVANDAVHALRKVVEERVGQLVDALVDPNTDFAVRRRLPRVFAVAVSQRAADGLMLGLDDQRFEVRFQSARSLVAIAEKNPRVKIDAARIYEVVQREAAVGRPVWQSQRLLSQSEEGEEGVFVDEFVKDRAGRSLAHVFTLLSLVLPAEPLKIAFRGLHTNDASLRGTALEYLEGVLPPAIRDALWPFLEDERLPARSSRARDEILADLLRSHQSIVMNLEELKRRSGKP